MAKRNANRELDQFLDKHGYHHSRRKQGGSRATAAAARAAPVPSKPLATEDPVDLVTRTAEEMESQGRFGFDKVFVAAIWDKVGGRLGMALPEFKHWLVGQNRRGALSLVRADVVGAMNPQMVARSEIQDRGSTFHFVVDKRAVPLY